MFMEYLGVALKELNYWSELFEITEEANSMEVIGFQMKYMLKEMDVENDIQKHINELYEKIVSNNQELLDEIEILIPTLNEQKVSNVEGLFRNIDDTLKIEILSYIYWKYKNKNNNLKANIQNLKKLLGLMHARKEDYIIPAKISIQCKNCNNKGSIYTYNYEFDSMDYKCDYCNHMENMKDFHGYGYNHRILLNCPCEACSALRRKIFTFYRNNTRNLIDEIKQSIIKEYDSYKEYKPNDIEMEKDYNLYSTSLNKNIREVLSYKPITKEKLLSIIQEIESRNRRYGRSKNNILNELEESKVIYNIVTKVNREEFLKNIDNLIVSKVVNIGKDHRDVKSFDEKKDILNQLIEKIEEGDYESFYTVYKNELLFKINDYYVDMRNALRKCLSIDMEYNYLNHDIIINHFYFEQDSLINRNGKINKELIVNQFKSEAEKCEYINLKNKYENHIVLPNIKLKNLINLEKIKEMFDEGDYDYLKGCIIDFAICNLEGEVIKLVELQKGIHHNEKEWVKKDRLKARAANIIGLNFIEKY